jgi:dienelactone hydrolase
MLTRSISCVLLFTMAAPLATAVVVSNASAFSMLGESQAATSDAQVAITASQTANGVAQLDAQPGAQIGTAHSDEDDAAAVAQEFEARFGTPTSKQFNALSPSMQQTVQRYFLHGPGAVQSGGMVDWGASSVGHGAGSGAQAGSPILLYGDPVPGFPGLFNMVLGNTGSGYVEYFALQVPKHTPTVPAPALVAFHQYGVSHADAIFHTNFVAEARERNWYMIAPWGASDTNFGSLPSQVNVSAVMAWARANLAIDPTRIYGVGFSMGGGGCASYAARHLDPAASMFAAIVDHTGTVSLIHAYATESFSIQLILEGWFGGSPAAQTFAYRRCSTIDIDPLTDIVGVGTDMARNLNYVHCWLADQDPQPYLPQQTQLFEAHMQAINPADVLTTVPGNVHSWSTLDDAAACDWLAGYTLQEPLTGNTLADQNGVWHRFIVEQDAAGNFTPFSWLSAPDANRLSFWATANLHRITVDNGPLGLVYAGSLKLNLSSADTTGDEVVFLHVPYHPLSITRNGVANTTCTYDPQAQTLLVPEQSGAGAQWVFHF